MKWKKDHKIPNSKSKMNDDAKGGSKRKASNDEYDSDVSNLNDSNYEYEDDTENEGFHDKKSLYGKGFECKNEVGEDLNIQSNHMQNFNKMINITSKTLMT